MSYKNLLGNFWPPKSVFIDHNFLKSLDQPSIKSGIGEMCHYFIYGNFKFFKNLINEYDKVLNNPKKLIKYISKSLQIKKNVIEKDEFEKGERKKFNYGHTFGHALETLTNYEMNHGQAVTVGMDIANFLSFRLGKLRENDYFLLRNLLIKNFPNHKMNRYKIIDYINILRKDKKNKNNKLGCIFLNSKDHMSFNYLNFDKNLLKNLEYYFNYFF